MWLAENGYSADDLGNAAGSLFLSREWEFTGEWQTSHRTSNHGHKNRVWRLKDGAAIGESAPKKQPQSVGVETLTAKATS